jgi:hypothetical protein
MRRDLVGHIRNNHARSMFAPMLVLTAVAALFLFTGPAFGDSCTADFSGELRKSEERGETMEHFFALVVRSSVDCATVGYQLEINQRTATGEDQVKRIANIITVRTGSDRARLVSHRTPKETEITNYEFRITQCNVCGT